MKVLFYIFGFLALSLLLFLIILGILRKPKKKRIIIAASEGHFNNLCKLEKVSCNTDQDCLEKCTEAQEGEEMVCQAIPPLKNLTEKQKGILGGSQNLQDSDSQNGSQKFCVPSKALDSMKNCDVAHGGIPVFMGWSGMVDHMEFDCMCAYPEWANSRICDPTTGICKSMCVLNPDICRGGTFSWDLTKKVEAPVAELCECAQGDVMVIDNSGLPRCVPEGIQHFYDDLDISSGARGGQEIRYVDGVPIISLNSKMVCHSCQCCVDVTKCDCNTCENKYTVCPNGCCALENAVCCGDFCCPTGYLCDIDNRRCIRTCCPQTDGSCKAGCCEGETVCSGGCSPMKDAVCCGDGKSYCPQNYPHCDTVNGVCNPDITPLGKGSCQVGDDNTQCPDGCCPFTNGTCCGDFCCPPEYPLCDVEGKTCKMFR